VVLTTRNGTAYQGSLHGGPRAAGAILVVGAFFTGPMALNVFQRQRAKRMGMAFSQNALADRETGRQLDDGTEQDIYRILRMPYLEA